MLKDAAWVVSELLGTDQQTSGEIFLVICTVLIGFLIIILSATILRRKFSAPKNSIYIAGISDSGKTCLFSKLISAATSGEKPPQQPPLTVTSQAPNVYEGYVNKNRRLLQLIDIPGADKVRNSSLTKMLSKYSPCGLIFVVDSAQILKDCREIAECLYSILADFPRSFDSKNFPILILCNKQDSPQSKSAKVVRSALEKEFALLTRTRGSALDDGGSPQGKKILLQNQKADGSMFDFERLQQNVRFVECSANSNVDDVISWIDEQ